MNAETLRAWRVQHSLTQRDTEELLGLRRKTVARLESGRTAGHTTLALLDRLIPFLDRELADKRKPEWLAQPETDWSTS